MLTLVELVIICSIILQLTVVGHVAYLSRLRCSRTVWYVLLATCSLMLSRRICDLYWIQGHTLLYDGLFSVVISGFLLWSMVGIRGLMQRITSYEKENRELTDTLELRIKARTEQLESVFNKMQKAKKQWERTFDAVPDMIMLLDRNFNIVKINKAAADALKSSPELLVGNKCYQLMHRTSKPPAFCPHLQLKKDGESHTVHSHLSVLNGDFLISVHPLTTQKGELVGAVHVARDVSELLYIQNQLREKQEKVLQLENAKTQDLLDVARSLNEGIAHELRTPMQSIMNTIELIGEWVKAASGEESTEEWATTLDLSDISELVTDAESRATYSISILESLASYTKAGFRKEVHLINVVPEIRTVMKTLCITDKFKCLSEDDFVLDESGSECQIKINSSDFMQLLINLCTNALEAVTHSEPKIMISVKLVNGWVEVHVVDNGDGINPDLGDSIFVPYVTTKGEGGKLNHGLGLSIVKNLISQYGGEISYMSVPGHTDFCMTFPCAKQ